MTSPYSAATDPLGHQLLTERVALIPSVLQGMLQDGLPALLPATLASRQFIITGTGSSEAHARYLATLLNLYTDRAATYLPLSGFTDAHRPAFQGKTLVVFSQGVSPNAQIALRRSGDFAHTILFTASTPDSARSAGKHDRARLLQGLMDAGGQLVVFPLAEEYTTLIRFVGPVAGYLACLQFVAQFPGCRCSVPSSTALAEALAARPDPALIEQFRRSRFRFAQGFNLVTAAPISDYAQNLACKFMEGVFWPCPPISDFLQFAHGPFQQMNAQPHPVLILQGDSPVEAELVQRSLRMLAEVGLEAHVLHVPLPPLLSIFGFEAALNALIMDLIVHFGVNQVNWPGKGRDDLLYGFCPDL